MLARTDPAPLPRAAFRAGLLEAVAKVRVENTRFYRLLAERRCPPRLLRRYAQLTVRAADQFCATLVDFVDKAPTRPARLMLLENLLGEEGIFLSASRGVVVRPEIRHPALARRFARACAAEEDPGAIVPATGGARALLAEGRWVEAIAHLLVGMEYPYGDAAPKLASAFQANGFSARDVAFFTVHGTADYVHGEQAVEIVLDHAPTRALQDSCIAEAHAGADAWIAAHGGLAG